jgi:cytochrome c5
MLAPLVALGALVTPSAARATETPAAVRAYMAEYSASRLAAARSMIPAWARRYNKNCDACHWPAVPRLNAYGMRFKWAGYRPPDELGEKVEVQKVENYLAVQPS